MKGRIWVFLIKYLGFGKGISWKFNFQQISKPNSGEALAFFKWQFIGKTKLLRVLLIKHQKLIKTRNEWLLFFLSL